MARQPRTVALVLGELEAAGLQGDVKSTKRHPKIRFMVDGKRYLYVVPGTTSDGNRALKNCRAGIRRLIRMALLEAEEKRHER